MIVHIYSGAVHSGKTSRLLLWSYRRNDIGGILTPRFYQKRYLLNISVKTARLLDAAEQDERVVTVGRHRFSQSVLDWGQQILLQALLASYRWLVVDEVGFLELHGNGLDAAVKTILRQGEANGVGHLLLVVRDRLRSEMLNHYGLTEAEIKEFNFPESEDGA